MKINLSIILMISIISSTSICTQEIVNATTQITSECTVTRTTKIQLIMQSFFQLVKMFITLITSEEVITRAKAIEELIASLIQTALHITNYSSTPANPQQIALNLVSDEQIKYVMIKAIVDNSHTLRFEPALRAPAANKPDETTQKVISHFSMIVQSFFNIVQDPENSENVTPNLINMLANVVTIGKEVMKRSMFSADTARNEIIMFVTSGIDAQFKNDLLNAFYLTVHRNGVRTHQ